jgi:hypothetical protein
VGNGNIDVGPASDTSGSAKMKRPRIPGAMAQQGGDSGRGNLSAPQKFVHLVGCRQPKTRPEVSLRPAPVKR